MTDWGTCQQPPGTWGTCQQPPGTVHQDAPKPAEDWVDD